jgi:pimeloyl-ACP methyl ester carboxylesterase
MSFQPFTIHVDEDVLVDLKQRLARTRWPDELPDSGWDYGTNRAYLQKLVRYWREEFDWRAQERLLNTFPQFQTEIEGVTLHFQHIKGQGERPLPLIMSHGWPGSFFEMYKVIGPLTDPARFGADPADAFDLVVPSLPGYGFSGPTRTRGMTTARMAELFAQLMRELGYERFAAQGGDWGSYITSLLGHLYPDRLVGIHINMLPSRSVVAQETASEEERNWSERRARWSREETGYIQIQGTRPQSLAYGLNDSPAGLAGWIVEKFRAWSDCHGEVESVFSKDELLTNVMIYWVTQTINSSTRLYYESFHQPDFAFTQRVEVPTGVAVFPAEISIPPLSLVQRLYNIQRWTEMPAGGHFAALEQPQALVEDIRAFFRPLRNAL